jgi:hypothetical protein
MPGDPTTPPKDPRSTLRLPPQQDRRHQRPFRAPKPRRWSHQDELDGHKGKLITLVLGQDDVVHGMLVNADAFTIQMAVVKDLDKTDQVGRVLTFFKHSIDAYQLR